MVKKTLAAILIFVTVLCFFSVPVVAEEIDPEDLSQLSLEELKALYEAVQKELWNRTKDTETPKEGCFVDEVTDVFDIFGEKTGEKHSINATATGYSKKGNVKGEVKLFFNDSDKYMGSNAFCFEVRENSKRFLYKSISYKIDGEEYVFRTEDYMQTYDKYLFENIIPSDSEHFQIIYDALYSSKDIKFSFDNGTIITTFHGEGFASLVEANK